MRLAWVPLAVVAVVLLAPFAQGSEGVPVAGAPTREVALTTLAPSGVPTLGGLTAHSRNRPSGNTSPTEAPGQDQTAAAQARSCAGSSGSGDARRCGSSQPRSSGFAFRSGRCSTGVPSGSSSVDCSYIGESLRSVAVTAQRESLQRQRQPTYKGFTVVQAVKALERANRERLGHRRANRERITLGGNGVARGLLCIHNFEGSWTDRGDPHWGGLQMDRQFQQTYGGEFYRSLGTADRWPAFVQLAVGLRAYYSGRGFGPWPNTRRMCGI